MIIKVKSCQLMFFSSLPEQKNANIKNKLKGPAGARLASTFMSLQRKKLLNFTFDIQVLWVFEYNDNEK